MESVSDTNGSNPADQGSEITELTAAELDSLRTEAVLLKDLEDAVRKMRKRIDGQLLRATPAGSTPVLVRAEDGRRLKAGTVIRSLPRRTVQVFDENAFNAWVSEHYPSEIEVVEAVNPAFRTRIKIGRDGGLQGPGFEADIPGVQIVEDDGPGGVSVRSEDGVQELWYQWRERLPELLRMVPKPELLPNPDPITEAIDADTAVIAEREAQA